MNFLGKIICFICMTFILSITSIYSVSAGFFDDFIRDGAPELRYCQGNECGLDQGIEILKDSNIDGIETERALSVYIQDIVEYILGFIALVSVLFIIYAWFQILISSGDEEKVKKAKGIILHALMWLIVIFLAWPIQLFIFNILNT